jgi:very-short-patch-repair endonuclease
VYLGGVLGGASALVSYGIWVDIEPLGVIVSCARTASRLPALAAHERRVWLPATGRRWFPWRVSVTDALLQYALDAPRDSLIAAVDSALNKKLLTRSEYHRLLAALPVRLGSIAKEVDGSAMSGTETHMRLSLVRAGYRVRTQVTIPNVGTVDMVVEEWLILELDSKKHHDGETNQFRDRTRDGNSVLGRYGHERFMWSHVFYNPEWCMDVVEARLREHAAFNMLPPAK